jgi:large subunit ribosomal protein L5
MNRLRQKYQDEVISNFKKAFELKNSNAVPRLMKVVVSIGVGTRESNQKQALESAADQMMKITGQKPKTTTAKQSIAGFNIREGMPVGLVVTLRGERMWEFVDKLIAIVLPKLKDFQGVKRTAFDQNGNYNLGLTEQIVFPEVDYDTIDRVRGLQITFVTTSKEKDKAFKFLEMLGMPFEKEKQS